MLIALLVVLGTIYCLGAAATFLILLTVFPLSTPSELAGTSLLWFIFLPIMWIGLTK